MTYKLYKDDHERFNWAASKFSLSHDKPALREHCLVLFHSLIWEKKDYYHYDTPFLNPETKFLTDMIKNLGTETC